jgi:hypothetical protein
MDKVRFLSKITLVASLMFALAFTLNACDNGSNDEGGEVSSSSGGDNGGSNSSSSGDGNNSNSSSSGGGGDETPLVKKTIVLRTTVYDCADVFTGNAYRCSELTGAQAEKVNVIGVYSESTAGSVYAPGSNEFKNILIGKGVSESDIYDVMFFPIDQKYVSTLKNAVNESDLELILDDLIMDLEEGQPVFKIYSDPNTAFWVYNGWTDELAIVIINTASNDRIELISILE